MIVRVFDVDHGSCNFIQTSTGKTELIDLGGTSAWSPIRHIYNNYIGLNGRLNSLVLTHHHGDHLTDIDNLGDRRPDMVHKRTLEGKYFKACSESNTPEGQRRAVKFASIFDSWTGTPSAYEISVEAWGLHVTSRDLSFELADRISGTANATVNNCSFVRLYNHNGTKLLLCGDMEAEGMSLLLEVNPHFASELKGVNVLIAPHHGHTSGFSTDLFAAMGQVDVVIASMMTGDANVDSRYSDGKYVKGIHFGDGKIRRLLTTRTYGAITVESSGHGRFRVFPNRR